MQLSWDDQLADLDWYAVDCQGAIGHFKTAGVWPVPAAVAASKEDLERLQDFFWDAPCRAGASVNPEAFAHAGIDPNNVASGETLVRYFVQMTIRGIYSYNCFLRPDAPAVYYRVAVPDRPLNISELPPDIQERLRRVALPTMRFQGDEFLDTRETATKVVG